MGGNLKGCRSWPLSAVTDRGGYEFDMSPRVGQVPKWALAKCGRGRDCRCLDCGELLGEGVSEILTHVVWTVPLSSNMGD